MLVPDRIDTDRYVETVAALTRATLQTNAHGSPYDFSDSLARASAATAADVGGPQRLIAGRSSSWESSCPDGLVGGTAGNERNDYAQFRTQPIVIRLNVAELIEDGQHHPGLMGLDEALENLGSRYESGDSEQDLDAWDLEIDMVTDRYTTEYRDYAARFAVAAHATAHVVAGLTTAVVLSVDTNPNSTWWSTTSAKNPRELDSDPIVLDIWRAAHDVTPLPNVDVWLGAVAGTATATSQPLEVTVRRTAASIPVNPPNV